MIAMLGPAWTIRYESARFITPAHYTGTSGRRGPRKSLRRPAHAAPARLHAAVPLVGRGIAAVFGRPIFASGTWAAADQNRYRSLPGPYRQGHVVGCLAPSHPVRWTLPY